MSELRGLLQTLEAEGQRDSGGVFSLDVRQLLPKLAQFRLKRPQDWVLKIIQAAVAAGAREIRVGCNSRQVWVEHDGQGLSKAELEHLFEFVFANHSDQIHLRHLAIGVSTALAQAGSWVQLESNGLRRRWTTLEGCEPADLWARSHSSGITRFVLARQLGEVVNHWLEYVGKKDIFQMLTGELAAMLPEQAALCQACRRCPVALWVNGKRVDQPAFGRRATGFWHMFWLLSGSESIYNADHNLIERWLCVDREGGFGWPRHSHCSTWSQLDSGAYPDPQGCAPALLAIRFGLNWPALFHFFQAGVLVCTRQVESRIPGLVALVSADDLEVDLSQFSLIDTPRLQARMRWLALEALSMAHDLRRDLSRVPMPARAMWAMENLPALPQEDSG